MCFVFCSFPGQESWQNEQEIFSTELLNDHPHVLHFIAAASRGVGVEQELWLITDFHEHVIACYFAAGVFETSAVR